MKLSLAGAAAEYPGGLAIVNTDERLDFSELHARVLSRRQTSPAHGLESPLPIEGHATLETLYALYAQIEARRAALLLHPRASRAERTALVALARTHFPVAPYAQARFPDNCLALLATSGSSGEHKLVALSYRAFTESAEAISRVLSLGQDDRWLLSLSPAHIGGLSIVTRCLFARAAVVLPRGKGADEMLACLHDARVTLASLVPTQLERLLQTAARPPRSLRAVLLGGAPASRSLLARAFELGWPLRPTYGMTETCSMVTLAPAFATSADSGSAGSALPGVELRIVDGAIHVRTPALTSGYLPPLREAAADDGWFCTRDLGFIDAGGRLHVLGRSDEAIVSGGEKVHPAEVEAVLCEAHGVVRACVFGVKDAEWGERVAAALVTTPELDWQKLDALLEQRLARFKHPRLVTLVDALAQTATGKIDRRRVARDCEPRLEPWTLFGNRSGR